MSASSLSLPIFLRINFLISYLDSNRLTEHIRLTHTESFAEWQKAGAGCTSRAFKHPGHDVTAPDVWPSILTDYTYDSELDNADGVPLAFRRSSMFPEGNWIFSSYKSSGLHDSSEIIIICWFEAQKTSLVIINVENCFCWNTIHFFHDSLKNRKFTFGDTLRNT